MIHILILSLALLVTGSSLWHPGGIVLLDYAMTSHPTPSWSHPIMMLGVNTLPYLFGYQIASKALFVLILVLAGYLGVRMARMVIDRFGVEEKWRVWMEGLGAVFFLVNPFAYERMMTQPGIYLGILLIGYGLVSLFRSPEKCGPKDMLLSGVFFGLAWSMFPHAIFMIALIYLAWAIAFVRDLQTGKYLMYSGGIMVLLNLNWLLSPLFGASNSVTSIASFGNDNIQAFLSNALPPFGPIATNLSLYGFWGERYHHFLLPGAVNPNWSGAALVLIGIVSIGAMLTIRETKTRRYGWAFLGIGIISLILGIGNASPLTAPIMDFLYNSVPYFRGFREPQKWIGVVLIVYGFFFLVSVSFMLRKWGKHLFFRIALVWSVFMLFAAWVPGMFPGFSGQIRATQYPHEFETLRTRLVTRTDTGSTLVLPWHLYMACPWTSGRIVANPVAAGLLSPAPVLQADNIEVGNVLYTNSRDNRSQAVENFIRKTHDFAPIRTIGTDTILLMKCADWSSYQWLDTVKGCRKTEETNAYQLYQCP